MTPTFDEIKAKALELGFDDAGITKADIPSNDIAAYKNWLNEQLHADLKYMENDTRCYPDQILPGAKTAIIFVSYYKQEKQEFKEGKGIIASYARGRDYHHVHRKRLKKFILWLEEKTALKGIAKGFSDSTPVLEKALAVQSGLGWFGKNSLLIHRRFGTFTLLAGLFTTLDIENPVMNLSLARCGSCQKCMDACPTQAIVAPYKVDASLCLSYHLIESKNEIPENIKKQNPGYIFGCDICQDACPHNTRKPLTDKVDFSADMGIGTHLDKTKLNNLQINPDLLFGTPLQRRKVEGLQKTARTLNFT
jgi:epoxyqueuosine reductase